MNVFFIGVVFFHAHAVEVALLPQPMYRFAESFFLQRVERVSMHRFKFSVCYHVIPPFDRLCLYCTILRAN